MALFSKGGNILKQVVSKHTISETYGSNPSIFQMLRYMSSSKLFVGGISYSTDDTSLREAFNKYGEVVEARVIIDRDSGRSRGFGFVTYTSEEDASAAIQALDGQDLHGRVIRVNAANDRPPRSGGFGGGGFGGGDNYGGGNYGGGGMYGGGNNYGRGGGYGSGNNYGGGGGDSYGGNNFPQGGTHASGPGYNSVSSGNYGGGSQGFGVAEGGSGGGNYASGGNQFGSNENVNLADASGGFGQDDAVAGNFRDDDDEPDNYANRRA